MPWRCPTCGTLIRPQLRLAGDEVPVPHKIYRCAVCRLELVLSRDSSKMEVAPLHPRDPPNRA
jgi:hypothetical protein